METVRTFCVRLETVRAFIWVYLRLEIVRALLIHLRLEIVWAFWFICIWKQLLTGDSSVTHQQVEIVQVLSDIDLARKQKGMYRINRIKQRNNTG